jgi:hypothetical protein
LNGILIADPVVFELSPAPTSTEPHSDEAHPKAVRWRIPASMIFLPEFDGLRVVLSSLETFALIAIQTDHLRLIWPQSEDRTSPYTKVNFDC